MSVSQLERITIEPTVAANACVIWLHGLGDSGSGFAPIVPVLELGTEHGIRFIFPHAPEQAVTINGGYIMRAWYDIKSMELHERADKQGVEQSERLIIALIEEQVALGIPTENIVLAGFSQGGVMSLYTGLRLPHKLAGIMALSCYLPSGDNLPKGLSTVNRDTPILLHHGVEDDVVPVDAGEMAFKLLQGEGFNTQWKAYNMAHNVVPEQLQDISLWLQSVLPYGK
ncbi:alpha/beta hydrolase [Shewanella schlegeliana]|uniref:Carboxylesterase n=1 Tax=Shewanella schlegeliana TaxID=190308 RepID=A0ABS1SYU6_9GAMM|nr:carboxylesterase [Shewanella schlegeliana]MBL4913722.1 carboxylesterase [Shewanella schlegeliana]MCL1111561.1 alpha/beta hydrolase [Shewanella schlegeliana]GIU36760.1 carboxylesterase [Shewanella schlegeliana]